MMFMRLLSLIVLLLMSVGCSTDEQTLQLIEQAESVMIEHPDSALNIIRSVDAESIRGEEDMAHYRLVMAEALYKNYIDEGIDSLTSFLYDYYLYHDDHSRRARAMYLHSHAMSSKGDVFSAISALHQAEKSLAYTENLRLAGLIYREKGHIYSSQCLFNDALESYKKADENFSLANLDSHSAYVNRLIGSMYSKMKMYEEAIERLKYAERLACNIEDNYLLYIVRLELCFTYFQVLDYESALAVLQSVEAIDFREYGKSDYYCALAIVSAYKGDFSVAKEYMQRAESEAVLLSNAHKDYAYYLIYSLMEDYNLALNVYKNIIRQQDVYTYNIITDSPLHYSIKLLEKDIEYTKEIYDKNRMINKLIYVLISVVFVLLLYYVVNRNKHKKQYIATLMAQVESVQNELYGKDEKIKSLSAMAEEKRCAVVHMQRQLTASICQGLQNINSLLDAYYTDNTKSLKQREIIAAIDSYVTNFAESPDGYAAVERFVNQYRDNIMLLLRAELSMLKESDYRLLCLIYAEFSSNAICMFMSYDKNKLYKQKSKLKGIITQSNSEYKHIFLKYL